MLSKKLIKVTLVILNKNDGIAKIKAILDDSSKFQKLSIDQNKVLNRIVHMENRIIDVLKKLKNKKIISEKKMKVFILLAQVLGFKDGVPPFRPIFSDIGTPTYKLSHFFVPLLTPLTLNEYTIRDSLSFAEELLNYDSNLIMASFVVESLSTNIPLQETIDLCVEVLFNDKPNIDGFTITDFYEFLPLLCLSH